MERNTNSGVRRYLSFAPLTAFVAIFVGTALKAQDVRADFDHLKQVKAGVLNLNSGDGNPSYRA